MAQRTTVTFIDDLDENAAEDVQTVSFAHEGRSFEIDLSASNREALADVLAPYKAAGRRAGGRATSAPSRTRVGSDASTIREWAAANGVQVSERGRIPAEVREKFEAAQK